MYQEHILSNQEILQPKFSSWNSRKTPFPTACTSQENGKTLPFTSSEISPWYATNACNMATHRSTAVLRARSVDDVQRTDMTVKHALPLHLSAYTVKESTKLATETAQANKNRKNYWRYSRAIKSHRGEHDKYLRTKMNASDKAPNKSPSLSTLFLTLQSKKHKNGVSPHGFWKNASQGQ